MLQSEIQNHLQFLNDLVLAHNLASAVDTDANVIEEVMKHELQAAEERRFAQYLSDSAGNGIVRSSHCIYGFTISWLLVALHCIANVALHGTEELMVTQTNI